MEEHIIKTIGKINNTNIEIIETGENLVPIKPICEALGVDAKSQREKIKNDYFLSSVEVLSTLTGSDGKKYEMTALPLKYIFGWLFTINPKNVKKEAQAAVLKYRMECYDVLYRHFTETYEFLQEKQQLINKELDAYKKIQEEFKTAKERLNEQKKRIDLARNLNIEEWKEQHRQLEIDFDK